VPAGPAAIVLLGGGSEVIRGHERQLNMLFAESAARALEAARVYHLLGTPWIISSGGPGSKPGDEPAALTMRDALIALGVPAGRILVEPSSRNTRDEAVLVAPALRKLDVDRVVLVTCDTHMRRALAAFRATGVDPVPAAAPNPLSEHSLIDWVVPTTQGLEFSATVVHEYAGLLYYGARGWLRF